MKQKILSLLVLLVAAVTGAWAQEPVPEYTLDKGTRQNCDIAFKVGAQDRTRANEGETVTITVTPNSGYATKNITVTAYMETGQMRVARRAPGDGGGAPASEIVEDITVSPVTGNPNAFTITMPKANVIVDAYTTRILQSSWIQNITAPTYNGQAQEPNITVRDGATTLVKDRDYTVAYSNNINAGTATVTITAVAGSNYSDPDPKASKTFTINRKAVANSMIQAIDAVTYTGSAQRPTITVKDAEILVDGQAKTLVEGTDYTVAYSDNVNAGTARVTITGIGNYRATATRDFTINKKALEDDMIQSISAQTYNGSERRPAPTLRYGSLTLRASTDYTYAYTENVDAGTATVTVTARANSNYSGTASKTFTINPKALNNNMIQPIDDQTYTGSELEPAPVVRDAQIIVGGQAKTLVEGTDYTVAYSDNVNAGTARVTITGIGNYTGTASRNFTVLPKELEKPMVQPIADRVYTGLNIKPELTVRDGSKPLVKGVDYTTVYEDFTAAGTAKVTVTGIGNYTGTVVRNYNILQRSLADVMMEPIEDQTYTGDAIEPALKLTFDGQALKAGTDYTATYEDNVIAGTAKVTVTGTGSYIGTATAEFTINPRTTIDGNITLVEDGVETELTINDAGTQQGKTVEEDLEVTTLNYYRTLKASDVNAYTICLPYAPPTDPNLKYYTLTSVDGTALHFDEIEGEPQAFTPYLVMASADVDISKEGYKETFTMSKEVANTSVAGSYVMKGTLSGIQHDDAVGLYIMQAGNRWAKVGSNTKAYIPPFRAYIEVTSAVPERLDSTIGGENFATEITSVCATDEDGTEHWFDLSGHPIEKPTKSGIYIHNGRKEYVK